MSSNMQAPLQQYNFVESREEEKPVEVNESDNVSCKHSRLSNEATPIEATCFFFGKSAGSDGLHELSTFPVDKRVWENATLVEDNLLLGKLSMGDMIALEEK